MEIQERVKSYEEAMLNDLATLVSYNSVQGEPQPDAPFGECRQPVWIKRWKLRRVMVLRSRMSIIMPATLKSARANR